MVHLYRQGASQFCYRIADDGAVLVRYIGTERVLTIPAQIEGLPVHTIAAGAFRRNISAEILLLPEGLRHIEAHAFENCDNLRQISFPKTLQTIESSAFGCCTALTELSLPDDLCTIGKSAFYGCTALKTLSLGQNTAYLGDWAFCACSALHSIRLPEHLAFCGTACFEKTIPAVSNRSGCLLIGEQLLVGCEAALRHLVIPEGVKIILSGALKGNAMLETISFPASLQHIGNNAFENCTALTQLAFPSGMQTIGQRAFGGCCALAQLSLPDSITMIGKQAFADCRALKSVCIPHFLTKIKEGTFCGCRRLSNVHLPEDLHAIEKSAFEGCTILRNIILPERLEEIGAYAFYGTGLSHLAFPAELKELGHAMLGNCSNLAYVYTAHPLPNIGFLGAEAQCEFRYVNAQQRILWRTLYTDDLTHFSPESARNSFCAVFQTGCSFPDALEEHDRSFPSLRREEHKTILALLRLEDTRPMDGKILQQYRAQVKAHGFQAIQYCLSRKDPSLLRSLCARNVLSVEAVDAGLQEAAAQQNSDCIAVLLHYRQQLSAPSVFDQLLALDGSS